MLFLFIYRVNVAAGLSDMPCDLFKVEVGIEIRARPSESQPVSYRKTRNKTSLL